MCKQEREWRKYLWKSSVEKTHSCRVYAWIFSKAPSAIRSVNHNFHLKKLCVKENCPWSVEAVIVLQSFFSEGKIISGKPKAGHHKDTTKYFQCTEYKFNNVRLISFLLKANFIQPKWTRGVRSRQLCCIASLFIICQGSNKGWLQVASPCMCSNCLMNEHVVSAVCVGVGLCGSHLHKWLIQSNRLAAV